MKHQLATISKSAMSALVVLPLTITPLLWSSASLATVEPLLGQIEFVGFNFCPRGWTKANGQILPINQNQSLFSLLGTTYGGDGRTTFALPDYRGRTPVGFDGENRLGSRGGEEEVLIASANLPAHTHEATTTTTLRASTDRGRVASPDNAVLADDGNDKVYIDASPDLTMADDALSSSTTISAAGDSPVNNMQPYLVVNACIALQGTFPSRN
jgi:microcystin-dependent protein